MRGRRVASGTGCAFCPGFPQGPVDRKLSRVKQSTQIRLRQQDQMRQEEPPSWYRVEYHEGETQRLLCWLCDVAPHWSTLTPFVSQWTDGNTGEVVLVEHATQRVVARRALSHAPRRAYHPEPRRTRGVRPLR